jgi:subtilisin family serine protease
MHRRAKLFSVVAAVALSVLVATPASAASGSQPNPPSWGLDRIDQRNLPLDNTYNYSTTADNVNVYVIDTGIDISHPDFGGRAHYGWDFVDNDAIADDCNGHGTAVAGAVGGSDFGVAKGVTLYAVKVLNCQGSGTFSQVVSGVNWVTANHRKPAVAVLTLGGSVSAQLDTAIQQSIAAGVTYVSAAGGSAADACRFSPGHVAEVINVAATDRTDARASFSNYGSCVDIFAPGVSLALPWLGGGSNTLSGSSWSAGYVAGGAALYLAGQPAATPQQVSAALVANGSPVVTNPGTGSPNVLLYTGS